MWTHILKRLHEELLSSIEGSTGATRLDVVFQLLANVEELGSDMKALTPALVESAQRFTADTGYLEKVKEKIAAGDRLTAEEWVYLSYAACLFEALDREWEEFYGTTILGEDLRQLVQ